ncbi:MAG TPA: hypothetical protein PKI77_04410 [Mycobacterium sp.]|nr:hypothetical protein [Mycobacterium sp.]
MTIPASISATIEGRAVVRREVEAWESRRAAAVLKKMAARLGARAFAELLPGRTVGSVLSASLEERRAALLTLKTGLGRAGIYAMLGRELAAADRAARLAVKASRGGTAHSVTRLAVPGCSAGRFAAWFDNLTIDNAEADMIDACPDHYLLRRLPDGRQEVVETTGGSPAPTRFLVDYADTGAVSIPVDPDYPVQIVGQAVLDDGFVVGGVRHQFRDRDGTMEALLTVEFPGIFPKRLVNAHCWHLATEFSNWVTASQR